MNAERLLAHFDRIADAPEAVACLRRFILDLAVRGKLVEQDPSEGNATLLLAEIEQAWTAHMSRQNIKKKKTWELSGFSDVPFQVPDNWTLVKLGQAVELVNGRAFKPSDWTPTGLPIVRIQNLNNLLAPFNRYDGEVKDKFLIDTGDLLISWSGTPGTSFGAYIWNRGPAVLNQHIFKSIPIGNAFQPLFLKLAINARLLELIEQAHGGVGLQHITKPKLEAIVLTLPTLDEQIRIVTKVDELMALCAQLEVARTEREPARNRLTAANLTRLNAPDPDSTVFQNHVAFALENLPPLTTRPDQIKLLRQTILSLAIHGKLIAQDPNDEPASDLMKRIALEKKRLVEIGEIKEKQYQSISEEKGTFEIPVGWSWCRLGSLSKIVTSGSRDWAKYYSNEGAVFVRMSNLSKDHYRVRLDNIQRVQPPAEGEGTRTRLEGGDLLISITGDVSVLGLIPDNFGEAYINQHTAMIRPMGEMKGRYLPELFRSPFAQEQFKRAETGHKEQFPLDGHHSVLSPSATPRRTAPNRRQDR